VRTQTERLNRYQVDLAAIASDLRSLRHAVGGEPEDGADQRRPALPPATPDRRPRAEIGPGSQVPNGARDDQA
jgi:hypothetical protein